MTSFDALKVTESCSLLTVYFWDRKTYPYETCKDCKWDICSPVCLYKFAIIFFNYFRTYNIIDNRYDSVICVWLDCKKLKKVYCTPQNWGPTCVKFYCYAKTSLAILLLIYVTVLFRITELKFVMDTCNILLVKHLQQETSANDLNELFSKFGEVSSQWHHVTFLFYLSSKITQIYLYSI